MKTCFCHKLKTTKRVISTFYLTILTFLIATDSSQRPAPLSYCFVRQAMALSRHTGWKIHCGAKRTLTTCRQTRQSRLLMILNKVPAFKRCNFFKEIWTIKTVLWLFNVSWQIAVAPQLRRLVNRSSLPTSSFIASNKHEWTWEGMLFQTRKDVSTHHFSSPPRLIF